MEVEVERDELDWIAVEGVPVLAAHPAPRDGLEVALVGVFQHERRAGGQCRPDLAQGGGHIGHVVNDALHHGGVAAAGGQRQVVDVGGDVSELRPGAQPRLSVAQHRARVVEHDDVLVAAQLVGHTSEARAQVHHPAAMRRQQMAQRSALGHVFVVAALALPKLGAVAGAFVIAHGHAVVGGTCLAFSHCL